MTDPAEKYRDKISPEHKVAMDTLMFMYQVLLPHRDQFAGLINAAENMHNSGFITDPTLYLEMINSKSFEHQLRLARAGLAFINECEAVQTATTTEIDPR